MLLLSLCIWWWETKALFSKLISLITKWYVHVFGSNMATECIKVTNCGSVWISWFETLGLTLNSTFTFPEPLIRISLIKSEYGPIWMKNEESCHYEISDMLIYHSNRETKGKGQQTLLHFTYYLVKSASVSFNDFHFPYGSSSPTQVLLYIFHVTI